MTDDVDRVVVKIIAVLLRDFAAMSIAFGSELSFDAELQNAWQLYQEGELHLVVDDEKGTFRLAKTRTAVERFRLKRKHRRFADLWRAMACEAGAHG